ncbi:ribosomal RNA small subunit methyltransferase A [Candidatus Falkowbacteria bacterium CG11_big_fil_rev_8_21_14_0_20_39_10]|uniref:Ribosomal RNA small subunit methyltransferase A n=1 Tax=Candidatus Falkowbacteria bacterium CG11_big_fil_rev_8_21_14_0_20_39_10 TaxID=1974570 RepID=A0A2M6KA65_9BACT|nr:MAG: ribosomal RNA small subunit methyltransferase A [Candidatus Falkowbacteria bacterium CG11_big_fil_rev_8_21_14_0_20_39_10]
MDLLKKTKQLCQEHDIKPARSRGQSFLISEDVYDKIIQAADLKPDDTILEVGPGLGFLTERLAKAAKQVVAVEIDKKLVQVLEKRLKEQGIGNVEVVKEDILKISAKELSSGYPELSSERCYKIAANLPYNITSIFLRKFLSGEQKPKSMTLMLQKEVAERIVAKPGKMSLLSVSVQFYAEPKIVEQVGKENFWPEPEVDSAVVNLTPHPPLIRKERGSEKEFFRLVKFGFSARRKMLKNNLAGGLRISQDKAEDLIKKAGFNPKARAQELSVKDWIKLFGEFEGNVV